MHPEPYPAYGLPASRSFNRYNCISPEAFAVAPAWRDGGRGNVAAMTAIVMIFEMTLHNRGPQLRRADPAVAGKHLHPALRSFFLNALIKKPGQMY